MKHLLLVRHGETDWSVAGRLNGWTNIPLNERGRANALLFRGRLEEEHVDHVWSSDLARATETAAIVFGSAIADRRLRELDFGSLEGATWDDLRPATQAGLVAFDGFAAPGGESVGQLAARVEDFLAGLPEGRHALVTHGGVIRLLLRQRGSHEVIGHAQAIDLALLGGTLAGEGRRADNR